ncbi:MAG: hypothetical protein A2Y86_02770 [Candidatus Aminicenantes bacterium RBG_13_62_12]|nr:MAG: hypothetical protein A2Y86_02770 [Candidatus Aminicenantes bacterium RBG_13_62_12]
MCLLSLVGALAFAQEFGSIRVSVTDAEGTPLPGVSATLTGGKIAPMSTVSSVGGSLRFMSLPVANDYVLRLELPGFKSFIQERIGVSFGRDVNMNITLEQATVEEEVTVIGQSPIIDTKRTQVGVNISSETLMSLPTARNPWVLMTLMPGILVDREDVGGNEGGQQSSYYGHGGGRNDSTWSIDGGNITDNSALGAAPAYVNIASYEEMQVNYGNNDVKSQTGGVQLNLVSKRGGNAYSGTFYLDVEDGAWQADNVPQALKDVGYTAAGVDRVYLYGANFGGPLIKDRVWFYGSWGIQDIDALTLVGTRDKTWLVSGYAKLDFQLTPSTRLNGFLEYDDKKKWGRTNWGAEEQSPETYWNQIGPGFIYKGEIDQVFGNLYLNFKAIYTDGGFELVPVLGRPTGNTAGPYLTRYRVPTHYATGNIDDYGTDRNQLNLNFSGNYFMENFLGGDHEFKFGADYVTATVTTFDLYEGNLVLNYYGAESSFPTGEWWEAWLLRDYYIAYDFKRYSFFLQDTATFGRLTVNLGIRYDNETSGVAANSIPASPWLPQYMPQLDVPAIKSPVAWKTWSPRVSLVYDLTGDGKNLIKFSAARYGSQSGFGLASFFNPVGWTEIDVIWQDLNGDGSVTSNELFGLDWDDYSLQDPNDPNYWLWYGYFDPDDPTSLNIRNEFDSKYHSPRLDEISLSYEREILTDFAGRIEMFYKRSSHNTWTIGRNAAGVQDSQSNYYAAGTDPVTGYTIYGRTARYLASSFRTNYPNRYDVYKAIQLVFSKRLSHKWMMDSSFTLSDWKDYFKGDYIDPQNIEYYDGGVVAPASGGSGLTGIYVNSRWQVKFSGLYQLPFGFNISGTLVAREGYILRTDVLRARPGIGNAAIFGSPDGGGKFGDERLPNFWLLNVRLEKIFNLGERSYVALSADGFNLTNSSHALKQQTRMTAANFGEDMRILNPRVFRFGIRFSF